MSGRAAQVAFYALLAVFPAALAILGMLTALDLQAESDALSTLTRSGLPRGAAELLIGEVEQLERRGGWALMFAILLTFYYGGRGLGSVVRGVMLAFSDRLTLVSPLRSGLLGVGITGFMLFVVPLLLVALTVSSSLLVWARSSGAILGTTAELLATLRWPILCLLFQQFIYGLYKLGARSALTWRFVSWGSGCATLAWVLVTIGFEAYLEGFAQLGATYGSLGAAIGLLLYVHLVSAIVLLGAELDAVLAQEQD